MTAMAVMSVMSVMTMASPVAAMRPSVLIGAYLPHSRSVLSIRVAQDYVPCVQDAGNPTQQRKEAV